MRSSFRFLLASLATVLALIAGTAQAETGPLNVSHDAAHRGGGLQEVEA